MSDEPDPSEQYEREQIEDTHDTGPVDAAGTYLGHEEQS